MQLLGLGQYSCYNIYLLPTTKNSYYANQAIVALDNVWKWVGLLRMTWRIATHKIYPYLVLAMTFRQLLTLCPTNDRDSIEASLG